MAKRSSDWHITGWKAFALLPIAVPVILLLKLFGIGKNKDRSAEEVAGFIREFIEGTGGDWDWDDFISVSIRDPRLETIRGEATLVDLPVTATGLEKLKRLLKKAEALAPKGWLLPINAIVVITPLTSTRTRLALHPRLELDTSPSHNYL